MMLALLLGKVLLTQQATVAQVLYQKCQAAVVKITTPEAVGSGFVVGDGHWVITCYHVIKGNENHVTVSGLGEGTVVRTDANGDIALIKVSRANPAHLVLAEATTATPGARVYVIGSPLGILDKSITEGTLSGIRSRGGVKMLQITAPISEGSSGSPVLDRDGLVIGMATSTLSEGQALNFAVGVDQLRRVLSPFLGFAKVDRNAPSFDKTKAYFVRTLVPTTVWSSMSEDALELYSARRGAPLMINDTKDNKWKLVALNGDAVGYIAADEVGATTAKEVDEWLKKFKVSDEVQILIDKLTSKDQRNEAIRKLHDMGPGVLLMVQRVAQTPDKSGLPQFGLALVLSAFGSKANAALNDMAANGNRFERQIVAFTLLADARVAYELDDPADDLADVKDIADFVNLKETTNLALSLFDDPDAAIWVAQFAGYLKIEAARPLLSEMLSSVDDAFAGVPIQALLAISDKEDLPLVRTKVEHLLQDAAKNRDAENPFEDKATNSIIEALSKNPTELCFLLLCHLIDSPDWVARMKSCAVLRLFETPDSLKAAESLLDDVHPYVRGAAILTAAGLFGNGLKDRISNLLKSKDEYERRFGVGAAFVYGDDELADVAFALTKDPSEIVRTTAVEALPLLGTEKAKSAIEALTKDPKPEVRQRARELLDNWKTYSLIDRTRISWKSYEQIAILDGVVPDEIRSGTKIIATGPLSKLISDDVIVGIQCDTDDAMVPVKSWSEIRAKIAGLPKGSAVWIKRKIADDSDEGNLCRIRITYPVAK